MYSLLSCYCLGSVFFGLTVYLDLDFTHCIFGTSTEFSAWISVAQILQADHRYQAGSRRRLMQRKDIEFNQYKQRIELEKQHQSVLTVSLEEWLSSPHTTLSSDYKDNFLDKNDS
ncbi:unnamed protein product [Trichobilharzia regenti]|nr:unnamed protein product [Trichobilharzia regenti]